MSKRQKKKIVQKETTRLKRRIIEKVLSNSKTSNVAFSLDSLVDGWLEIESDPGTFSLLIEDFGCFGAQVDEIYDLEQKFDGPVFGFIFLFKWLNNQHNDRLRNQKSFSTITTATSSSTSANNSSTNTTTAKNTATPSSSKSNSNENNNKDKEQSPEQLRQWSYVEDENIISEMFFAKQMISNSCATHALISILLNCDYDELNLGPTLTRLKENTKIMDPESKGYAIGNVQDLAMAHNSHASYSSLYNRNRPSSQGRGTSFVIRGNQRTNLQQQNQHETYHFVSYVPINNRLYELDGLKNYPIDHGPYSPKEGWTEKFRSVIKQRLSENLTGDSAISNDIRYNLMAVVPDKRVCLRAQLKKNRCHLKSVQDAIKRLTKKILTTVSKDASGLPNPPYSPLSNGTLTSSEPGSPSQRNDLEDNQPPNDAEIPNPPYSPLSNGTLTASEASSVYNSPTCFDDCSLYDDDNKVEKYYFIKFDQQAVDITDAKDANSRALEDLKKLSKQLSDEIDKLESSLKEENDKRLKYKIDNSRRTHNYEPFIMTFLSMLAKQGNLANLIEKDLGISKQETEIPTPKQRLPSAPTIKKPREETQTQAQKPKPKYKYVSTGRPRGRPRKHPIVPP